jgi:hypothetical protein
MLLDMFTLAAAALAVGASSAASYFLRCAAGMIPTVCGIVTHTVVDNCEVEYACLLIADVE